MLFVTGAGGFIGRALVRNAAGLDVRAVPRGEDPLDVFRKARPGDALAHAAWPSMPGAMGRSAGDQSEIWSAFAAWSAALAHAASKKQMWFIGLGSGVERYADDPARLGEPYLTYARRKIALRDSIRAIDPERFSWLRLHFLFGPGERATRIIPSTIAACRQGGAFASASLDRKRRWLHVDDAAALILRFAENPAAGGYDIAGQEDVSFRQMFSLIENAVGEPLRLAPGSHAAADDKLIMIEPENMAPIVPPDAGRIDNLLARLTEYVQWLDNQRATAFEEG